MFSLRSRKLKPKDPSMDEILSSIRSMVENDEGGARTEPSDFSQKNEKAEVFDLTEMLEDSSVETPDTKRENLIMAQELEEKKVPLEEAPNPKDQESSEKNEQTLDADQILDAVESDTESMALLSEEAVVESMKALKGLKGFTEGSPIQGGVMDKTVGSQTVDALTRELLHPMLKTWLDANLPSLVKWVVEEQIEKLMKAQMKEGDLSSPLDSDMMSLTSDEEVIEVSSAEESAA